MKKLDINIRRTNFGFSQNLNATIENKSKSVVITVHKADHPTIVEGHEIVSYLINGFRDTYESHASEFNIKEIASNGWLAEKIKETEKDLEKMKFLQKVAKRKCFEVKIDNLFEND